MAADWIKKAAREIAGLTMAIPDGSSEDYCDKYAKFVDSIEEVIARNVPPNDIFPGPAEAALARKIHDHFCESVDDSCTDEIKNVAQILAQARNVPQPQELPEKLLKEWTRDLVQKPRDPKHPGNVEAKMFVMFNDAEAALRKAFEFGAKVVPQGSAPEPSVEEIERLLSHVADAIQSLAREGSESLSWKAACSGIAKLLRTGWPFPDPKIMARDVPQSKPDGWISVKDQLPGFSDVVIVVIDGIVQDVPAALSADDRWEWMNEGDSAPKEAVSHWQPFPKFVVPLVPTKEEK